MTSRLFAAALSLLIATAASAQVVAGPVASDLDGDGMAETFTLIDSGRSTVDLRIEASGAELLTARNIAWKGGVGQQPELDLAANGSVLLTSMNEAIGRDRWRMTLTIAYRAEAYRVAGFTFSWYDTLDNENNGVCDLNLLTGRGVLSRNGGPDRVIRTDWNAPPVTEWNMEIGPPEVCERG